jgi:N-acetylmuramic acid 6-phosphate etherase
MSFVRTTEAPSRHRHLETLSVADIVKGINEEDATVPAAVRQQLPQITALISAASDQMLGGGRLFYIGAGTSGRLGVVDASECPPTFGVPHGLVVAIIAGGGEAILKAVENAEDHTEQGWNDLQQHKVSAQDFVVGIAASGTTPYVIEALRKCQEMGIPTGSICCNAGAPLSAVSDYPVEVVVGPEYVTGSTRMKSGTAQKLVLNMISTACMIQLGRVEDNRMVHMQLTNEKLVDRGVKMIMQLLPDCSYDQAQKALLQYGSVKRAVEHAHQS